MEANKIEFLEIYLNYHLQRNNQSKTATAKAIGIQALIYIVLFVRLNRIVYHIKLDNDD